MTEADDKQTEEIIINEEMDDISRAELEARKAAASKPMIDHLPDAISKDEMGFPTLLAGPGERIIIERVASILQGRPWLDTKTYTIESIDAVSGRLSLWDDDLQRSAGTNFIEGLKVGYRFKLPTRKGMNIGHRKRGRPRKNPEGTPVEKTVELGPDGQPIKKKRGRPAGSKNRERAIIMAEKKAKLEMRKHRRR